MKTFLSLLVVLFLGLSFPACSGGGDHSGQDSTDVSLPLEPHIVGQEVSYTAGDVTLKGYIAFDENHADKAPGILVIHEWWGHNDFARERAMKLAEEGYVALAVDMYGDGKQAAHPEDAGEFAGAVMGNIEVAEKRFDAAVSQLKANPHVDGDKIAAVGFCFGGSVAMTMANMGKDLDGVAAFHSGVTLPEMPKEGRPVVAKMLICQGADDPFLDPNDVTAFKEGLDKAGVQYQYITYPGAVHAFTNPGADSLGKQFELPLAYNADADKGSWTELIKFLEGLF